jgi:enoyl-CoA hydratase/carnithine racemase
MIGENRRLTLEEALEIGIVAQKTETYKEMIETAISEVKRLENNVHRITDGPVEITPFTVPDNPVAGKLPLSKEALSLAAKVVNEGAAAETLKAALEINYQVSGDISCIDASKEGVSAFLQKRKPEFKK